MATKVVPTSPKQKKSFILRVVPDSRLDQELEDATDESKTIQQLVMYHFLNFLPKPNLVQPGQKVKETFLIMKDASSSHQNRAVSESDLVGEDVQKEDWREKSSDSDGTDYSLFPEQLLGCREEKLHALVPQPRKMRNLLVTIENDTPLEELSKYVDISVISLTRNRKTRRWYTCPLCGRQFSESSYLISHQRTHTGEKPYDCSHCGKSFNHKTNLNKHERIHTGEKPYSCSQCGKTFRQNCHRSRHEGIHVREKTFKCPDCGKTFPNNEDFLLHLQTHEIERPYGCKNCGRRFGRLSNCTRHERTHSACKSQSRSEVLAQPEVS
ncbi:zinc finger protein 200 isoform X3 [Dipodomys spectabilis]|uniref:zinc finger protein 200 isoform X3 n=1 Tax=Dipodomys spectabilis TaxID=105255 RepID=UPI001C5382D7|nr:zinc finger protein 200 isoform X3 [Dipodomys spectabilis]